MIKERENKMSMGKEFNFVIDNGNVNEHLVDAMFDGEDVDLLPNTTDMFDILVMTGMFRSKSEARKNWKRTGKEIPEGFTDIENIGKLHKRLTIWNPIKEQ
jgi:hypothetical protein